MGSHARIPTGLLPAAEAALQMPHLVGGLRLGPSQQPCRPPAPSLLLPTHPLALRGSLCAVSVLPLHPGRLPLLLLLQLLLLLELGLPSECSFSLRHCSGLGF